MNSSGFPDAHPPVTLFKNKISSLLTKLFNNEYPPLIVYTQLENIVSKHPCIAYLTNTVSPFFMLLNG